LGCRRVGASRLNVTEDLTPVDTRGPAGDDRGVLTIASWNMNQRDSAWSRLDALDAAGIWNLQNIVVRVPFPKGAW
jgi:hypothetical protein